MGFVAVPDKVREEKIERLLAQHGDGLLRLCYAYLGDAALSEDALQETFLSAYRHLDSFRGESSEKTWLTRIAINACKDIRRSRWFRFVDRRVALEDIPEPVCAFSPEDETLIKNVMALPAKLRAAVLLYYYQGLSAKETADALHIATPTVYQRLKKAQAKLKTELEGWYFDA